MEFRHTGGAQMSETRLERLRVWLEAVENVVVIYHEDIKHTPAIGAGGFKYVDREEEDGRRLVRLPEGVEWTPERERLLSRP